jgi:hypothetical protein
LLERSLDHDATKAAPVLTATSYSLKAFKGALGCDGKKVTRMGGLEQIRGDVLRNINFGAYNSPSFSISILFSTGFSDLERCGFFKVINFLGPVCPLLRPN